MYGEKKKIPSMQSSLNQKVRSYISRFNIVFISFVFSMFTFGQVSADISTISTPDDARSHGLESLKKHVESEGIPLPDNLSDFIDDQTMAEQMGKALFHEMMIGSDGIQACVTCHFTAGADSRQKNIFNPGGTRVEDDQDSSTQSKTIGYHNAAAAPDDDSDIRAMGPNGAAKRSMWPFVKDIGNGDNVIKENGLILPAAGNKHDVASSAGIINNIFDGAIGNNAIDPDDPEIDEDDPVFNVIGMETRKVEPRNTPTVINAVFNFHQFWDGRANNRCNGKNPFGGSDGNSAKIFVDNGGGITEDSLNMRNASLCSQALGPVLSHFEMAYRGRGHTDIADKLLDRQALSVQKVHKADSLLASLRHPSGTGLTMTYREMIQAAFKSKYWDSTDTTTVEGKTVDLITANWSFFQAVTTMLYQATLVSDQSYFDRWMETGEYNEGFRARELRGLNLFVGKGHCANCHSGPELTAASVSNAQRENNLIETMRMRDLKPAMYDNGFYNIGVTPTTDDLGRGGLGPNGKPLSHSRQFAMQALGIDNIGFDIQGAPIKDLQCKDGSTPGDSACILGVDDVETGLGFIEVCIDDGTTDGKCGTDDTLLLERVAVDGSFKTPGLRNVQLTAPYMHNGGFASLKEVVQFYNRGGNFCRTNSDDLDPDIRGLGLTGAEEDDLVAFMISLTDIRVRHRKAPFDGPEVFIPNGHKGNFKTAYDADLNGEADDNFRRIPQRGKNGGREISHFFYHWSAFDHNEVRGGVCSPDITPEEPEA